MREVAVLLLAKLMGSFFAGAPAPMGADSNIRVVSFSKKTDAPKRRFRANTLTVAGNVEKKRH